MDDEHAKAEGGDPPTVPDTWTTEDAKELYLIDRWGGGYFDVTPEVTWEPYDFNNRPELGLPVKGRPSLAPAHGDD